MLEKHHGEEEIMVMTDPIADMLTRIRNAGNAEHESVDMQYSKVKEEIAKILKREGFIKDYTVQELQNNKKKIVIFLAYDKNTRESLITNLVRKSKPGRRIYRSYKDLPPVLNGYGIAIISTSKGILTDKECKAQKVGGEVLCYIW